MNVRSDEMNVEIVLLITPTFMYFYFDSFNLKIHILKHFLSQNEKIAAIANHWLQWKLLPSHVKMNTICMNHFIFKKHKMLKNCQAEFRKPCTYLDETNMKLELKDAKANCNVCWILNKILLLYQQKEWRFFKDWMYL